MRIFDHIAGQFRALFRSRRLDADLAEEMRFHIERETEENIARGMSRADAHKAARMLFGSVDNTHETARDDRPGVSIRQVLQDAHFGLRLLVKSPVFFATGVAIVALGIGTATGVFTVANGVLLQPLPFDQPDRLVSIWLQRPLGRNLPAAADANDLRELTGAFEDVALFRNANLNLVGEGEPERLQGARVSVNLFNVLRAKPILGRVFTSDEDRAGRENVVVLSHALWRARFGGDDHIIGKVVSLNGASFNVVGVMARDFQYPTAAFQAWIPLVLQPGETTRTVTNNYRIVARLREHATLAQARQATLTLAKRLASDRGSSVITPFAVDSMLDDTVRDIRPALLLLLGAVLLLLLIACVNLSNLFGARATARKGEFAIRLALGASRTRLVTQAIAESMPMLLVGGIIGVLLAQISVRLLVGGAIDGLPRAENIVLSLPVVAFAALLLAITGCVASIAPATQAWKSDFTAVTKDGGRSATSGRKRSLARQIGVAVQISFALPLLVGGSLLLRSALNVSRVDLGFIPGRVSTYSFEVSRAKHPTDVEVASYYQQLVSAVDAIPGVMSAGLVNRIPLAGGQSNPIQLGNAANPDELTSVDTRTVTPDYFKTLEIELIAGRHFTERDDPSTPTVVIVDERIAATAWPGQDPVGKRFRGPVWRDSNWVTVVGVVAHIRTIGLESDPLPQVYWSYKQWPQDRMVLALKTSSELSNINEAAIRAIRSVDADQSVYDVRTLPDIISRSMSQRRMTTVLMATFSGLALLLAAVGIYGVIAYGVSQRLREFGIRVALGASRADVKRLVVWQGAAMGLVGSAVGLIIVLVAQGALKSLVFGVETTDALSVFCATLGLMIVAMTASYIPARRAAAVDPGVTLRSD